MRDKPHRMIHYNNLRDNVINWECMKYPCSRKYIDRFEELGSGLIPVNLFKQFNKHDIPDRTTQVKNAKYHVDLYMVEGEHNKYHYVLINNLRRLMGNQYNKHKEQKHICPHCLKGFQTTDTLTKHFDRGCLAIEGQQIQLPKEGDTIHFQKSYQKV